MDANTILNMRCEDMREELRALNLITTALKEELQNRLLSYYQLQRPNENINGVDNSNGQGGSVMNNLNDGTDSGDETETIVDVSALPRAERVMNTHFSLKDFVESLTLFNGTDAVDVNRWRQELEDAAATIGWSDLQCFVFGKQLLRGAAKLFIRSQSNINNWRKLKQALKEKFSTIISAAEVHEILRTKRKNKNETMLEFLYSIMEIGKNISLDEKSVVNYFVDGIPDSRQNKLVLYQATNIKTLKEAIKVYEKVRGPHPSSNRFGSQADSYPRSAKVEVKSETHTKKRCQKQQVKCFKRNKWGHRSFECQQVAKTSRGKKSRKPKYEHDD